MEFWSLDSKGLRVIRIGGNVVSLLFFLLISNTSAAQLRPEVLADFGDDPCGYPDTTTLEFKSAALLNWGYSYDSLKADLARWSLSPFVRVDSVGATVQNRAMYMMTIQDTTSLPFTRKRVWIHTRTHPNEVQSTWVTNEIIKLLLSNSLVGRKLRDSCIFNIMPMYNPDGVELARPRENANGIDLESNWSANPPQPEVQVLRRVFTQLMSQPNPIRIALNMHSALACRRYFVYHAASGTSNLFATMQQQYIGFVRSHFPGGIEPHTYFVSWTNNPPPTVYPESWFWYNHREAVLANTYEDKNCTSAGGFDSTALAILQGIGDYLNISGATSVSHSPETPRAFSLGQNYPNPFNPSTTIEFSLLTKDFVSLDIYDVLGEKIASLISESLNAGTYTVKWIAEGLASGMYFYRLRSGDFVSVKRMVMLR